MQRLSSRKQLSIIKLYLDGHSYDEIATRCGVSKGSVSNVISELKAGHILDVQGPAEQLELLRELSSDIRRHHLTPGQAILGLTVLSRLQELGIEPSDVEGWAAIFRELVPNEAELSTFTHAASTFTHAALALQEIQERTGLSVEALEKKAGGLEREVARLEPIAKELERCPQELEELKKRKQILVNEIEQFEKRYKPLQQSVTQMERREKELFHRLQGLEGKAQASDEKLAAARSDLKTLAELVSGMVFNPES